jgi:hypothetical protein
MAYDYGNMREGWMHHYLTDWVGDDGFVHRQYDEVRKFNYLGDTQIVTGEVVGKRAENGRFYVDLACRMTSQRGTVTMPTQATVLLPSREHGPVILPESPMEEQVKAAKMWKRHGELLKEKGFKALLT